MGGFPKDKHFHFEYDHTQQVRKTPCRPRSWANSSILWLCSHRNAWTSLHLLGQPNTFLASGERQIDIVYLYCQPNLVWYNGCTKDNLTPFSLPALPLLEHAQRGHPNHGLESHFRAGCPVSLGSTCIHTRAV
jgi:hypothetical protein